MKYPLDMKALEDISRDILQHDKAQHSIINQLCSLLQDAMSSIAEDEEEDLDWFEEAKVFLKERSKRNMDFENHRFNQKNGHNLSINSPYAALNAPESGSFNQAPKDGEEDFGAPMTEEEVARHFGEAPPKKVKIKKSKFEKMTLEEINEWEKAQDNSNDIYKVSARIKNLAREGGGVLTPAGVMLTNSFAHVCKALYDYADTIQEKDIKIKLIEVIRRQESMPAALVAAFSSGVKPEK